MFSCDEVLVRPQGYVGDKEVEEAAPQKARAERTSCRGVVCGERFGFSCWAQSSGGFVFGARELASAQQRTILR